MVRTLANPAKKHNKLYKLHHQKQQQLWQGEDLCAAKTRTTKTAAFFETEVHLNEMTQCTVGKNCNFILILVLS